MGKNNKKLKEGTQTEHCPATVFISKLPFSLTTSQLEESFSDVGPIRRCFMVTKKGTTEHKGVGFVQFATAEDADRAIELKDGSDVGGRKIAVKYATHRAPLEKRRPKLNKADSDEVDKTSDEKDNVPDDDVKHAKSLDKVDKKSDEKTSVSNGNVKDKKSSKEVDKTSEEKASSQKTTVKHKKSSSVDEKGPPVKPVKKAKKPSITPADKGKSSEKQRVARTVVFGGLFTPDIAEEVLRLAREIDGVCSVTYPLPKGQLQNNSLHQDGCRPEAASVVYASIRSALAAVAALHQKQVNGRSVWARQLGGEGSKTQKWKIIIRNLPFKVKNSDLKEKFSAAGLVWDVFIPKNSETGMSKGFAFVKFTSKHDAENAILKFNGKQFGTRTIAVDWAVPKKLYTAGLTSSDASKDGKHGGGDADSDGDDGSEDYDLIHETQAEASDESDINSNNSDDEVEEEEEEKNVHDAVDFDEEVEISRKILQNLITSSKEAPSLNNGSDLTKNETKMTTEGKQIVAKPKTVDEDLTKTVFISNLPFDLDNEEVKQRFSSFGEVQSFFPVLHPVTKRPRGTGFLKFTTADGADNAVTAANTTPGLGVFLKGRQLTVFKALDKKSADDKALEKSKVENQDQRNLYLAKEGLIVEGTPAAEGVSSDDLAKRQSLQQNKTSKLQSPNFHVSKTRLVIYNCPKSMTEKQLKKLCIDAVTSKASKQTPVIRQLKFLNDVKKGKVKGHSRGVAFVEFGEHQHAIVALRVLNNNPEPFGPNHRPIVEFAVDNVQTLRKRTLKIHDQLQKTGDNPKVQQNDKERTQKRKFQDDKRSKEDHQEQRSKTTREDGQINQKRNRTGLEREERKLPIGDSKKGYNNQNPGKFLKAVNENPKKRKVEEVVDEVENSKKRNRSKNKEVVGKDVGDKLDVLIQQYRSKFSQKNSDTSEGEKQGSRQQIRRWFQS